MDIIGIIGVSISWFVLLFCSYNVIKQLEFSFIIIRIAYLYCILSAVVSLYKASWVDPGYILQGKDLEIWEKKKEA